jgi:hypothetical protein
MTIKSKPFHQLIFVLLSLCIINILLLDLWIINQIKTRADVLGTSDSTCPQSCLREIQKNSQGSSTVKELFIPLGSGSGYNTDWTDIPGVFASINKSSYSKIKSVVFETTVTMPSTSQKVWIRLYNITDKHPVWYSEISTEDSGPKTLTSAPITLDSDTKEYQLQLKTQLGGLVNITNAKIRISTY